MTAIDFRGGGGFDNDYRDSGARQQRHAAHADDADHGGHSSWDGHDHYHGGEDPLARQDSVVSRVARLLNYIGALVSVALMVGLLVWGYRLVTRDVSGVPVIQALEGEARIAPDDPGGQMAEGRGLAVNAIAAGRPSKPVDQVEIAPETAGLTADDLAMGRFGATARAPGPLAEVAPDAQTVSLIATSDAELKAAEQARVAAEQAAAAQALVIATVAALPETTDEPAADAAVDSAVTDLSGAPVQAAISAALADAAALDDTPVPARPVRRPQRLAAVMDDTPVPDVTLRTADAPAEASAQTAADTPPARVASLPGAASAGTPPTTQTDAEPAGAAAAGTTVVQIGAFDSDKLARGEWGRVSGKNGDLFAGKSQIVQKTERNGRTFWRLRVAGFGDRDEARAFCSRLKAAGTDCIPTAAN